MFILDFVAGAILDLLMDWLYTQIVGALGEFFAMMGGMGADLFALPWVQAVVLFFYYLAWALYVVGLVVALFEYAIERQGGRGDLKGVAMNAIKGFLAVGLFSTVPVELYKLCVDLQGSFSRGLAGLWGGSNTIAEMATAGIASIGNIALSPLMILIATAAMGYAVIKVFFANLKRGGILLIQIAVGSLYMFSVPRGYLDGFTSWCKQIVGLCLTTFLQAIILSAGLQVFGSHMLLGLGLMLSASEVPRIAGQFGLDTSTKANLMSAVHTAQAAVNTTQTIVKAVSK